jgi:hypothetical protein
MAPASGPFCLRSKGRPHQRATDRFKRGHRGLKRPAPHVAVVTALMRISPDWATRGARHFRAILTFRRQLTPSFLRGLLFTMVISGLLSRKCAPSNKANEAQIAKDCREQFIQTRPGHRA